MANCLFKLRDLHTCKASIVLKFRSTVTGIGQLEFAGTRQSYMPNNLGIKPWQIITGEMRASDARLSLCFSQTSHR